MPKPIRLSTENFLVFAVIIFAAAMRLWNIENWTFTNDELSALSRLQFDSWWQILEEGIKKNDAHPAGTQFFLYIWTSLFGTSEIAVRIPFVTFGILSTFGIYQIGKKWVHSHAGIIAATLFAGLGYTITYSLLARPYSLGILAVVLVLLFWTKLIRTEPRIPFFSYLGLACSLALCAYTHYFAAVAGFIIYALGFLMVGKKKIKPYLFTGLFAGILYIPHIGIFIHHFTKGGGGTPWLGAPESDAIFNYLDYAFNETWMVYTLLAVFLLVRLIVFRQSKFTSLTFLGLALFGLTFCFAFFYSIYKAPIFQYSVMVFGFIGLLLTISDLVHFPKIRLHSLQVLLLMGLLVFTTIFHNDYRIESRFGTFEKIAIHLKVWDDNLDNVEHVASLNSDRYLQYYLDKHNSDLTFSNLQLKFDASGKEDMRVLAEKVRRHEGSYFTYSKSTIPCLNEAKEIIKAKFPRTLISYRGNNCESTLFTLGRDKDQYLYRSPLQGPGISTETYMMQNELFWKDLRITEDPEACFLAVTGKCKISELKETVIVVQAERNGELLQIKGEPFWNGRDIRNYTTHPNTLVSCAAVIDLPAELEGDDKISIYLYNPNNVEVAYQDFEVKMYQK